ncbi:MAG TPA: carboxylating nicotinate-nucleotide diphosphorylase [Spirochaetia bacterium]|nr:carboxylating nicotinate-nucleotide diphosphorylase [Spirochaetia bacterium]
MDAASYNELVASALAEDLGDNGDVTTQAIFNDERGRAVLISKDRGVLAGIDLFAEVFRQIDPEVRVELECEDGSFLKERDVVARLEGRVTSLLAGERVALNFLSYLSGIASATRRYVEAVGGDGSGGELPSLSRGVEGEVPIGFPTVLDTRKTLPGYRNLAKYAVSIGGGRNHRIGLHDMVLIKDNHIDFAGSIRTAVERVRAKWGERFVIEVECRDLDEVQEALECGCNIIMLDNMDRGTIDRALEAIAGRAKVEVSGNMDLEKIASLSESGVDFISVGRLTHSVEAFDFSLKVELAR